MCLFVSGDSSTLSLWGVQHSGQSLLVSVILYKYRSRRVTYTEILIKVTSTTADFP